MAIMYNTSDEEKRLLGAEATRQTAKASSSASGTKGQAATSGYDKKVDSLLGQSENYGSFQYGNETAYQKALDQVANPQAFNYDMNSDPSWAAYQKQYQREGQRARANALAQAAAASGGRVSSYAMMAASQAGDYYASQMADKIPTLQQNAYQRYLAEQESKQSALSALQNDRSLAYGEWADGFSRLQTNLGNYQNQSDRAYGRYQDQRDFDYQQGRDQVADQQWQQTFDYGKERDLVADQQWQKTYDRGVYESDRNFGYQQERDQVGDQQWQQTFDYGKQRDSVADQQWQKAFDAEQAQLGIDNQYRQNAFDYQKYLDGLETSDSTNTPVETNPSYTEIPGVSSQSNLAKDFETAVNVGAVIQPQKDAAESAMAKKSGTPSYSNAVKANQQTRQQSAGRYDSMMLKGMAAKGNTSKANTFVAGIMTEAQAKSRGITSKEYEAMVKDKINKSDLSNEEAAWVLQKFGYGLD